jgi:GAF domain-containing protein
MADKEPVNQADEAPHDLESLNRKLQKMGALYQVGQILTASLDLPTRLENVVDLAIRLLGADRGSIMLLDTRKEELEMVTFRGLRSEAANARTRLGEGIAGWVAEPFP